MASNTLFLLYLGDNSVLMQKVAKEHLEMFKGHKLLKPDQVLKNTLEFNIHI